jgi:hypothetical protein
MQELTMRRGLCALTVILPCLTAHAGFDSGNRLYEDCASANYFNRGYCAGYIVGIVDTVESMQAGGVLPKSALCIPEGVTKGQLTDVVGKFLAENPVLRNQDAGSLVPQAINAAFPCK